MPLSDSKSKRRFLSRNNPLPIVLRSKMSRAPRTGSPQSATLAGLVLSLHPFGRKKENDSREYPLGTRALVVFPLVVAFF